MAKANHKRSGDILTDANVPGCLQMQSVTVQLNQIYTSRRDEQNLWIEASASLNKIRPPLLSEIALACLIHKTPPVVIEIKPRAAYRLVDNFGTILILRSHCHPESLVTCSCVSGANAERIENMFTLLDIAVAGLTRRHIPRLRRVLGDQAAFDELLNSRDGHRSDIELIAALGGRDPKTVRSYLRRRK